MESGWFTIIGVVLGAILSPIGTYFVIRFNGEREEKIYIKRKREDLYLDTVNCLFVMSKKIKPHVEQAKAERIAKEIDEITSRLRSRFVLYASTEAWTKFAAFIPIADIIYSLADKPEEAKSRQKAYDKIAASNDVTELIEMMKKEIGTLEEPKSKGFQCNLCSWIQNKFSAK